MELLTAAQRQVEQKADERLTINVHVMLLKLHFLLDEAATTTKCSLSGLAPSMVTC